LVSLIIKKYIPLFNSEISMSIGSISNLNVLTGMPDILKIVIS